MHAMRCEDCGHDMMALWRCEFDNSVGLSPTFECAHCGRWFFVTDADGLIDWTRSAVLGNGEVVRS